MLRTIRIKKPTLQSCTVLTGIFERLGAVNLPKPSKLQAYFPRKFMTNCRTQRKSQMIALAMGLIAGIAHRRAMDITGKDLAQPGAMLRSLRLVAGLNQNKTP